MEMKEKKFIRWHTDVEMDQEQVDKFYNIVDDILEIKYITSYDAHGNEQDETAVTLLVLEDSFIYEILTVVDPLPHESKAVTERIAEFLDNDFEISTTLS